MGCVSSHLLNQDDDFTTSNFSQHIVSLTSTTYGLLTLDPSSSTLPPTPPRFTLGSIFNSTLPDPRPEPSPDVINSWELMAGLDSTPDSSQYHFLEKQAKFQENFQENENANPNHKDSGFLKSLGCKRVLVDGFEGFGSPIDGFGFNPQPCKPYTFLEKYTTFQEKAKHDHNNNNNNLMFKNSVGFKQVYLDGFEKLCPPNGENRVVIYTTTLRGVRKTFEACNAVRAVFEGFGVSFCERDVSMDRGFRDELWELMKGREKHELVPPRVFVKGRYVGGCDEVLKIAEEGCLGRLLEGLPRLKAGYVCEACGGARFLPCVVCNGSCKMVMVLKKGVDGEGLGKSVFVKCSDCNENGLVCCPICS